MKNLIVLFPFPQRLLALFRVLKNIKSKHVHWEPYSAMWGEPHTEGIERVAMVWGLKMHKCKLDSVSAMSQLIPSHLKNHASWKQSTLSSNWKLQLNYSETNTHISSNKGRGETFNSLKDDFHLFKWQFFCGLNLVILKGMCLSILYLEV